MRFLAVFGVGLNLGAASIRRVSASARIGVRGAVFKIPAHDSHT